MKGMKGFAILSVSNLILVRIWLALQPHAFPRYWINFVIFGVLIALDTILVRAGKASISHEEGMFIRQHLLLIGFVSVVALGATNSLLTIITGKGKIVPDYTNLLVGLMLVPLIVSLLRRSWERVRKETSGSLAHPSRLSKSG